jgi:AmmeMemoRadiSam system protein B/AmmeMemoRadiSam system protein A
MRHTTDGWPGESKPALDWRNILRYALLAVLAFLIGFTSCRTKGAPASPQSQRVREPVFAGSWYPSDSLSLYEMASSLLEGSKKQDLKGDLVALWVPHAGYSFSGAVAAEAFKQLEGKTFETVIVIGPSHRYYFEGISVDDRGFYKTPLGLVPIDTALADQFKSASSNIYYRPEAHSNEHSVEVELPFLQRVLGSFKLVPVVFGNVSLQDVKDCSDVLTEMLGTRSRLLVISADLSHYHTYERARELDLAAVDAIKRLDAQDLAEKLNGKKAEIDAPGAAMATIAALQALGAENFDLLEYANSGDVMGDKSRVVGYAALAATIPSWSGSLLTRAGERELLKIARVSIEAVVLGREIPEFAPEDAVLKGNCGAFVTITKEGMLRGCIGYVLPVMPLYRAVSQAAVSAATKDARFPPVSPSELDKLHLEISVLTPPRPVKDVSEIQVGKDGLIVRMGNRSGLLLPQVASSRGWNRTTFLEETCRKAGLPADAWKSGAQIYAFNARVFEE